MNAREYFQQIKDLDAEINNLIDNMDCLYSRATSITASADGDRVQSSSSPDKMAGMVCKMVDAGNYVNEKIDTLATVKSNCKMFIANMEDTEMQEIFFKRFFDYAMICDICSDFGRSRHWVYDKLREGFAFVDKNFYNILKNT